MVQGPIRPWYYDHKLGRRCIWGGSWSHCWLVTKDGSTPSSVTGRTPGGSLRSGVPVRCLARTLTAASDPRSTPLLTQMPTLRTEVLTPVRRARATGPRLRLRPRFRSRRPSRWAVLGLVLALAVLGGGSMEIGRLPWIAGGRPAALSADEQSAMLQILEDHHYRQFDAEPLADAPVAAWASLLGDPFTRLIPADDLARLEGAEAEGYVGIGVRLQAAEDRTVEIAAVDADTPAAHGGLRPGDEVLAVDGAPVAGLDLVGVTDLIEGPEGSVLALSVRRPGAEVSVTIQRGTLKQGTVTARLRRWENGVVGVITVPELIPGVGDELRAAVDRLAAQGADAFVVDLRHNPGGPMAEAVGVAGAFLPAGTEVATEVGRRRDTVAYATEAEPVEAAAPVVVLVDDLTSGTAEVVAGALGDHGRALVAGAITAGQGGLQERYLLPGGDALQTTYASYVTPLGRTIERNGVAPDVVAPTSPGAGAHLDPVDGTGDVALDAALRAAVSQLPAPTGSTATAGDAPAASGSSPAGS